MPIATATHERVGVVGHSIQCQAALQEPMDGFVKQKLPNCRKSSSLPQQQLTILLSRVQRWTRGKQYNQLQQNEEATTLPTVTCM
eukprot:SAG31_NODE_2542_length_5534_cov_31.055934_6_plen_85_part_00